MTTRGMMLLALAAVVFGAGVAAAAKPKPKNDGLPAKWYGVTSSRLEKQETPPGFTDTYDIETHGAVTFTLVKTIRSPLGNQYTYAPSGSLTVRLKTSRTGAGGTCTTTIPSTRVALEPGDAVLQFDVWKGKRAGRATYNAAQQGTHQVKETDTCPKMAPLTNPTSLPAWIGFGSRKVKPTATKLEETYDNPGSFTFEWCLVRKRSAVLSCSVDD